jgi:hypothetical protein
LIIVLLWRRWRSGLVSRIYTLEHIISLVITEKLVNSKKATVSLGWRYAASRICIVNSHQGLSFQGNGIVNIHDRLFKMQKLTGLDLCIRSDISLKLFLKPGQFYWEILDGCITINSCSEILRDRVLWNERMKCPSY